MKKIILFLSLLVATASLEAAPTIIANNQINLNALVSSNTVSIVQHTDDIASLSGQILSNDADIVNLIASDVAQDVVIGTKLPLAGGQLTGELQILHDSLKLGLNGAANGDATISFSGFVSAANATATLFYDDTDGNLYVTHAAGTAKLGAGGASSFQALYNLDLSDAIFKLDDATGFLRIQSFAGVNILQVDENLEKVTVKELAVTTNAIITGNLTVNGTTSTLNTDNTFVDALSIVPGISGNVIDIIPTVPAGTITGNYVTARKSNAGADNWIVDVNGNQTGGTYNSIAITSKIRSADSSFWKKGALAVGVFSVFQVPDAMTITSAKGNVLTVSSSGSVGYKVERSTDGGATWNNVFTADGTILQTTHNGVAPTLDVTQDNWAADDIIRVSITTIGTGAADFTMKIVGSYDN